MLCNLKGRMRQMDETKSKLKHTGHGVSGLRSQGLAWSSGEELASSLIAQPVPDKSLTGGVHQSQP